VVRVAWALPRRRAPVRVRHVTGNARGRVRAGQHDGNRDRTAHHDGKRASRPDTMGAHFVPEVHTVIMEGNLPDSPWQTPLTATVRDRNEKSLG
jgi:hypothetical protein